jgi:hypothetical protein
LELFETHTADVLGYADDRAIISIANDINIAQQVMQTALNKAQTWADTVGLKFSIAKTKAIIFSRQKEPPTITIPLQMADEDIEEVNTFKYLGVVLDSCLNWTPHFDFKVKKAKKYLMAIHQGIGTNWGPTPEITRWLYTGIIRPFLTYGTVVWARKATMALSIKKLQKVQRLGIIRVAPMRHHTPSMGLEVVLGIPPLELYIQEGVYIQYKTAST